MTEPSPLLRVRDLSVQYGSGRRRLTAVDGVSFDLYPGQVLGLAGESGSGKSTIAHAILRTLRPPAVITGGEVLFDGNDLLGMDEQRLERLRWKQIALVFQSAMNALNPVLNVGAQIQDVIIRHDGVGRTAAHQRARELLELVGIEARHTESFPHELSGGMRQRVVIAIALALRPRLLLMDEPTTALDVVVQKAILDKLTELKAKLGFSVLFITHDLSLLFEFTDVLAILYAGRLAELGPTKDIQRAPRHPYTAGLTRSFPPLTGPLVPLSGISGSPPALDALPSGCRFHPRCPRAVVEPCARSAPEFVEVSPRHRIACYHPEPAD